MVREDLDVEDFLKVNRLTFERQDMAVPYTDDLVRSLDLACNRRKCRKILMAEDQEGRLHAGIYIVWDEKSAYYIMGGADPEMRSSGATCLLMWEAIKSSREVTKIFDFEGSMIEPIERFFRGFGARQKPYFSISKNNSRLLEGYDWLRR
jgi:hypothetical protein